MTAYRTGAPLCPTCREPLEAHGLDAPSAEVDLCKRCGGVWLDWEDGDFTSLARELPPASGRILPREGPGVCPRCRRELKVEVFQGTAEVLRCGECAGAFLPYPSIGKIASGTPSSARYDEDLEPLSEDTAWARTATAVRAWLLRR